MKRNSWLSGVPRFQIQWDHVFFFPMSRNIDTDMIEIIKMGGITPTDLMPTGSRALWWNNHPLPVEWERYEAK